MNSCLIVGGSGYIGYNWARRLSSRSCFQRIVLADLKPLTHALPDGCEFVQCDVRVPLRLEDLSPQWIFNFAAVHREPGHAPEEYFDTNLAGAENVCAFADQTGCENILFTSSIAVYGAIDKPTTEASPLYPSTPYGVSKLCAELIQKGWQRCGQNRRLRICRPGAIYGPGDPGNILRMIRAAKKGYFLFPGTRDVRKSYGYIEGLLDSFEFVMGRQEDQLTYNYVERETETLGNLVSIVQRHFGTNNPTFTAPLPFLEALAAVAQFVSAGRSSLHPVRVRKTTKATHILPESLLSMGFRFRYDFATSLREWAAKRPEDFS